MKKYKIIYLLIFMLPFIGFAQKSPPAGENNVNRKVTLKQQLLLLNAGKDNPDKAQPIAVDERFGAEGAVSEESYGPANDKALPLPEEVVRSRDDQTSAVKASQANQSKIIDKTSVQPEGIKPGSTTDYRNMNDGNAQPEPGKPEKITDYKGMSGGHEQPEAQAPLK